jgi:hypothetical protein
VVIDGLGSPAPGPGLDKAFEGSQPPDGVFAVIAARGAELIQNAPLVSSAGLFVAQKDGFDIFAFGSRAHDPIFLRGNSPVTWNMRQFGFRTAA